MNDALQLIIAKSPVAMNEAIKTMMAIGSGSSMVQQRYNHTVESALLDRDADWTAADRELLASYLEPTTPQARDTLIQIRVSAEEKRAIRELAETAGMTVADYIRSSLLGVN